VVHHAGGLEGSQQQQQLPVLIAGAGPVGLTAAAFLASWRVPVRIVDSRPAPTDLSKALVTWRRSLATLDPLVPCDEWLEEAGVVVEGVAFADEGRVFASMELGGTPGAAAAAAAEAPGSATTQQQQQQHMLPPGILTPQSEVEARLDRVLQRCGVVVERGMQLTAFSVDDDGGCVRCSLAKTSGGSSSALLGSSGDPQEVCGASQVEEVAASVLIGADGARSAVRKGLGCAFDGFTRTGDHWLLADVRFEVQPGINSHAPTQPAEEQPQPGRWVSG
jgi:2-polyprenyl-6-methoxyphenol hydroxylase-like FAD-dependent oxidoreductase